MDEITSNNLINKIRIFKIKVYKQAIWQKNNFMFIFDGQMNFQRSIEIINNLQTHSLNQQVNNGRKSGLCHWLKVCTD